MAILCKRLGVFDLEPAERSLTDLMSARAAEGSISNTLGSFLHVVVANEQRALWKPRGTSPDG